MSRLLAWWDRLLCRLRGHVPVTCWDFTDTLREPFHKRGLVLRCDRCQVRMGPAKYRRFNAKL